MQGGMRVRGCEHSAFGEGCMWASGTHRTPGTHRSVGRASGEAEGNLNSLLWVRLTLTGLFNNEVVILLNIFKQHRVWTLLSRPS